MNRSAYQLVCRLCLLVAIGAAAALGSEEGGIPAVFVKAAEAFAKAPETNRLIQAQEVFRELPKCPLFYERDVGTGIYRSYDFSKPSYDLSSKAVLRLLGNPITAKTNAPAIHFFYLAHGRPHSPAPADWLLEIQFRSDKVVYSKLATRGPL